MTQAKPKGPCSNIWKNRHLKLTKLDKHYLKELGGVYFIQSGDFVKIGCTSSKVEARRRSLQTAHFRKLKIIHVIACFDAGTLETSLHKHFKDLMTESKNEWFRLEGELKKFIDSKPMRQEAINFLLKSKNLNKTQKESVEKCRTRLEHRKDSVSYLERKSIEAAELSEEWGLALLNLNIFNNDEDLPLRKQAYEKFLHFIDYTWGYDVVPFHNGKYKNCIWQLNNEIKHLDLLAEKGFEI
jgi:hypothetical protein